MQMCKYSETYQFTDRMNWMNEEWIASSKIVDYLYTLSALF